MGEAIRAALGRLVRELFRSSPNPPPAHDPELANLQERISYLRGDALVVLSYLVDRLLKGQERYGPIWLDDPRDWDDEMAQELGDYVWYALFQLAQKLDGRTG